MIYKLFIDDLREPWNVYKTCTQHEWTVVRSYDEFVACIKKNGLPFVISFDHDLADEHYLPEIPVDTYKEKTGLDCAKWLVEYCLDNKVGLPKYNVHSANPAGSANIRSLLASFERHQTEN